MLRYNASKYDFSPVSQCIAQYYPIREALSEGMLKNHPGYAAIGTLLSRHIHNHEEYQQTWESFCQQTSARLGCAYRGTTYGQAPSYSADFIIAQHPLNGLTITRQIQLAVSLLGPFYSVVGAVQCESAYPPTRHQFSTHCVIASPAAEYAVLFQGLMQAVEAAFPSYRLLPYWILNQSIEGLRVYYDDQYDSNRVSDALLNDRLPRHLSMAMGDVYFGSEAWIRPDWDGTENVWVALPPGATPADYPDLSCLS